MSDCGSFANDFKAYLKMEKMKDIVSRMEAEHGWTVDKDTSGDFYESYLKDEVLKSMLEDYDKCQGGGSRRSKKPAAKKPAAKKPAAKKPAAKKPAAKKPAEKK